MPEAKLRTLLRRCKSRSRTHLSPLDFPSNAIDVLYTHEVNRLADDFDNAY